MKPKRSGGFADQVRGNDERTQAQIEVLDDVWDSYWSDAKRILSVSSLVFVAAVACSSLGWKTVIVRDAYNISGVACIFSFLATVHVHYVISHHLGG